MQALARVKSHAGGVTRPGTIGVTPSRASNVAPRSPRGRAEAARNPLGDGHLRPSALSFVGGDHPDRHPPHFAPSDRRSPPRLPRDFYHGLPAYSADDEVRSQARQNVITVLNARFAELNAKIEAFETRIDAKIEALETRIDAKIENAQGQIDSLRAELSGRLDAVNSRIDTLQRVIWPLVVLLASTVFGLLYRVLTVPQPGP